MWVWQRVTVVILSWNFNQSQTSIEKGKQFTVINTPVFGQCCHFNFPHFFVPAIKQKVDHNGIQLCSFYIIFGAWRHAQKLLISILFPPLLFFFVSFLLVQVPYLRKSVGTSQLTRFLAFSTSWHFILVINCVCHT